MDSDLYHIAKAHSVARDKLKEVVHTKHRYTLDFYINIPFIELQELREKMAKKIAETKKVEYKKAEFKGFANVELDLEAKAEMREYIQDMDEVYLEIENAVAEGYKFTFMRSEATGGYQATMFASDNKLVNAGYILSAFAPHWLDAMACLIYKHVVRCEKVWPTDKAKQGDVWG